MKMKILIARPTPPKTQMDIARNKCFFVTTYSKMSEWMIDRPPGDSRMRRMKAPKDKIWFTKTTYRNMTAWIFEADQQKQQLLAESQRRPLDKANAFSLPQLQLKNAISDRVITQEKRIGNDETKRFDFGEGLSETSAALMDKQFRTRAKMGAFEAAIASPDFSQIKALRPK